MFRTDVTDSEDDEPCTETAVWEVCFDADRGLDITISGIRLLDVSGLQARAGHCMGGGEGHVRIEEGFCFVVQGGLGIRRRRHEWGGRRAAYMKQIKGVCRWQVRTLVRSDSGALIIWIYGLVWFSATSR